LAIVVVKRVITTESERSILPMPSMSVRKSAATVTHTTNLNVRSRYRLRKSCSSVRSLSRCEHSCAWRASLSARAVSRRSAFSLLWSSEAISSCESSDSPRFCWCAIGATGLLSAVMELTYLDKESMALSQRAFSGIAESLFDDQGVRYFGISCIAVCFDPGRSTAMGELRKLIRGPVFEFIPYGADYGTDISIINGNGIGEGFCNFRIGKRNALVGSVVDDRSDAFIKIKNDRAEIPSERRLKVRRNIERTQCQKLGKEYQFLHLHVRHTSAQLFRVGKLKKAPCDVYGTISSHNGGNYSRNRFVIQNENRT